MDFGEVLTRTWNIIWKHKVLWLFGLLASLAGGGGGSPNAQTNFRFEGNRLPPPFYGLQRAFENISPLTIFLISLLVIALVVILIVVGTLGRAGLIRGAWLADAGEADLTFGRLWREAQTYFWRVLLLGVLIFVFSLALILILIVPTVLAAVLTLGIALICLLPFFCLFVLVLIVLSVIFELAIVAITGENLDVMQGLTRAWEVFRAHLGEIIGMGLIITIGSAVVSFIVGIPLFIIMLPFIAGAVNTGAPTFSGWTTAALVLFVLYLPILLAVRALLTSYVESAWTVTFRRLTGRSAGSGAGSPLIIDAPSSPVP